MLVWLFGRDVNKFDTKNDRGIPLASSSEGSGLESSYHHWHWEREKAKNIILRYSSSNPAVWLFGRYVNKFDTKKDRGITFFKYLL